MKNVLFTALALITFPSLTAQVLPPTSVPVNKTKTSLLTKQVDQLAQHDLQTNFRLFLNYSAKSDLIVKFGNHPVEVPAGEKVTADFTFEHLPNSSALIHLSTSGDPTTKRIEVPGSLASDGNMAFKPLPGKDFPMDKAFTLMARFNTKTIKGTLVSLAPAKGKWERGGKTLFIQDGRLSYDVGWEGMVQGEGLVNDGKEHLAALVGDHEGNVTLYLDGKKVAGADDLTSKDKEGHTLKVGSTTKDFGGDFEDGSIEQVLFWKRSLSEKEISTAAKKKIDELNTPDFHWRPLRSGEKSATSAHASCSLTNAGSSSTGSPCRQRKGMPSERSSVSTSARPLSMKPAVRLVRPFSKVGRMQKMTERPTRCLSARLRACKSAQLSCARWSRDIR